MSKIIYLLLSIPLLRYWLKIKTKAYAYAAVDRTYRVYAVCEESAPDADHWVLAHINAGNAVFRVSAETAKQMLGQPIPSYARRKWQYYEEKIEA